MKDKRSDKERQEESRRILERVQRDSDMLSGLSRTGSKLRDHFAAREAVGQDWTELWGRRIARALALIFVVVLIIWILSYFTGPPW